MKRAVNYWKSLNKVIRAWLLLAAFIASLSTTAAVASEYRWWVWRGEFIQVADDSYKGDIQIKESKLLSTRLVIHQCRRDKCSQEFLIQLLEGETMLKEQINELKDKREKVKER